MASRKNAKFSTQVQFYLKHRESRILKLCNDTIGTVPNDSLSRAIFKLLSKPVDNKRIIQLLADKKRSSTKSTASHSTVKTPQTMGTPTGALTATIPTSLATANAPAPASMSLPEYQKDVERFRGRIICQDNTCIIDPMASPKNDNNSNPRTHSFRIVSFSKEGSSSSANSQKVSSDCSSSPLGGDCGRDSAEEQAQNLSSSSAASTQAGHKAILMCFSCKLSFGTCRSFIAHAKMEHSLTLNDYERMLLEKNYSSAIIQTTTEKQFYFLVPFEEKSSANSNTSIKSSMESEERFKSESGTGSNGGSSQQLSPMQQTHLQQQQQLLPTSVQTPEKSPGSISYEGVFPKLTPSSMLYDMDNKLQASWKLAAEKYNNAMNESVAAAAAAAAAAAQEEKNAASGKMLTDFLTQQKMLSAAENLYSKQNKFLELMNSNPLAAASAKAAAAGAGTDGASDYHLAKKYNAMDLYKQLMAANTFRPEGLELKDELKSEHQISVKKLETEPTAAFRNNSFAPNISTRNSCKTLKCPQCNWHYKYQETLEIHMREKHPDGETACSYCLAGQQHPRLARGESYTCGYKPYRCDICNYSTTTKGNLSIHMQSDKHLNNMQDLNGMMNKGNQNFLNLATLQANEKVNTSRNQYMPATSPLSLSTKLPQQAKDSPSSYEPNRPKSFFKCDICNYDTNIARNLRIHMTSEKHISNLNSLQSSYNQLKNLQTMSSPESLDYLSALNLNALKEESPLNRVEDYTNSSLKPLSISSSPFAPIDPTPVSTASSTPTPESLFLNNPSPFSGGSETERSATNDFQQQQHQQLDEDKNPLHFEPPIRVTLDPSTYYTCLICSDFDTNNLEELKKHVIKDRLTSNIAMDTIVIAAASCECLLCGFRAQTADKHELERHLKTEAHLKRLDLMIHLLEGRDKAVGKLKQFCGTELFKKLSLIFPLAEESKFPYEEMPSIGDISRSPLTLLLEPKTELIERDFGGSNGIESEGNHPHPDNVQIKCNCCNYYTTSLEKIGLHSLSEKHIFRRICFDYLLLISSEKNASSGGPSSPLNLQHSMKGEDSRPGSAAALLQRAGQLMLTCVPCGFKTDHIYYMIHHLRKSCKVEQNINLLGLRNIFKLTPKGADSQDAMDSASAATGDNSGGAVSALCSILQEKKPWNGENCNGKTGATGGGDGTCKDRCLVCSVCNNFSSKKINVMQHLLANHNIGNELLAQDFPSLSVPSTIQKKPFDYLRTLTEARSAQNLRLIEKVTFMNDSFALKENCNDLKHGNLAEILENYMGGKSDGEKVEKNQAQTVSCPLCPETFLDQVNVETHVIRVHNIKMEGLNRLLKLVDTSQFLKTTKQQQLGSPDKSPKKESSPSPEIKCSFCKVCFDSMVDLKIHCNESNHFKRNADSEDLACFLNDCKDAFDNLSDLHHHFKANHLNFLISENHTYKYRCKLCPFAFKTHEKLNRHLFYHSLRESTKCFYCDAHFKNINSLTSHIAEKHPQESSAPKGANESHQESASILFFKDLKRKMMNSKNGMSPKSDRSQTRDSADEDRLSEKSMSSKSSFYYDKSLDGSDGGGAAGSKFACNDCRFSFTDSAALERHMATAFHMSKEREKAAADSIAASAVNSKQQLFYDIKSEKFTNPNRPFKCTICMESFTQKNILLVHYNSVSHLNKLKKFKSDKQQQQQQFQFGLGASMGDSGDGCEHEGKQQQQQQQQQDFKAFGLPMFMQEAGEKRKDIEEKETARKKFKCDICNVAYTQGSTLDIHMRSVLHQTRACRLQERSMFSNQLQGTEKKKSDFPLIQTIPESHESPNFIDDTPMRKIKSPAELQQQQQQQQPLPQPQIPQQPPPMLNPMMGALGMGAMAAIDKPEIALCECCFQVFPNKATLETHLELSPECSAVKKKMMENNPSPENFADGFQQQALNELAKVNSLPGFDLTPEALLGKTPFPLDPTANLMDPNFLKNASLLQFATDPNNKLGPNALNVLNFMHFHHLMSLSYLNLAPQLNFGAVPPKVPDMTGKSDLEKAISADKAKMQSVGMPQNLNGKSPLEMNLMAHNLESKMPPQPPQQQPCTQKRARTRITDEQLRILRSHFDINNSPSEESIQEMSLKANLPPKVVKHWFRNTLFKERQRSKDSPYNFSIPPSTKLNVEEYERTGETKVTDLETSYKSNESQDLSQNAVDLKMNEMKQNFSKSLMESLSKHQATQEMGNFQLNKNLFPESFNNDFQPQHDPTPQLQVNVANFFSQTPDLTSLSKEIMSNKKKKIKSESSNESPIPADLQIDSTNSSPLPMRPPSVISLKKHMDNRSHGNPVLMEEMKIPSPIDSPVISPPVSMAGGMHQQMTPNQSVTCSNGKRANRTRFTDYQIKVLQEFFENNSYPKDSDLEYLSKLLMLSPRVIVVWFQNARQKQRKIYENQPNPTFETDEKKAININYTCKKCNLVFQRYYELIRHQKNHCFKEESNKRSAKAQLAAAQIAHSFTSGSEDSDSSLDVSRRDFQPRENDCPF